MQAAPQHEAMCLHGILHRIEGDYNNARAWYGNVKDSVVFHEVWNLHKETSGTEDAMAFLTRIEILRKETKITERKDKEVKSLELESLREIKAVLKFCEDKFRTCKVEDASKIWMQDEKSSGKGNNMIVCGEGWRQSRKLIA
jgi:hypothetical protein